MTTSELRILLKAQVESLTKEKALEFGLDICIKLLPEYKKFMKMYNWGNVEVLEEAIQLAQHGRTSQIDRANGRDLIEEIEAIIPDTEDFGTLEGSLALSAGATVLELLEYVLDEDLSHILNISSYMTDTIDFQLQQQKPNLTDLELSEHQEVRNELTRQIAVTK